MAQGFYHANYFHANYWHANYWSAGGSLVGAYWHDFYYHDNYWHSNYWAIGGGPGEINQVSAPVLGFTALQQTATASLNVGATTPGLSFTPQNTIAGVSLVVSATAPSISFTPQNTAIDTDTNIYQLGDIDLRFVPDSDITVTYGVVGTTPTLPFTSMAHTIEETGGINVAASLPSLGFTTFVTDSRLDIAVEPIPPAIGFAPQNTTAGAGQQIGATQPIMGFTTATHTIVGSSSVPLVITPPPASLQFTTLTANIEIITLPEESEASMRVESDSIAKMRVDSTATARMRMI